VTVVSNNGSGYALTVHRSAFAPNDLPLGIAAPAGGPLVSIPISPAPDLLIASSTTPSAAAGDVWPTGIGFASVLPVVGPGHYTATLTFTVIAAGISAAAISVSPVRIRLAGAASRAITITNAGNAAASVDVRPAGFVLDPRGKPAVARERRGWLHLQPRQLVLAPGGRAIVTVSSAVPFGSAPGDHPALVLFTTRRPRSAGVAIRMRIGVVVFVRVAGRIVHRLAVGGLRARRRVLEVVVVNRGNVVERAHVRIFLLRSGHVLARLGSLGRIFLPHSRGVERFRYAARLRGWATARVELGALRRNFRVRL
jgi:hypothetical protein